MNESILQEALKMAPDVGIVNVVGPCVGWGSPSSSWMLAHHRPPPTRLYDLGSPAIHYVEGRPFMTLTNIPNIPGSVVSDADVTWLEPQIKCPNCGSIVNGLGDAKEELPPPRATKFNQLPGGTVNTAPAVLVWRSHPCNCKVSQEWAGAYAKEVQNRKSGGKPGPVQAMTPLELEAKKKALEKAIANLMILKGTYETQLLGAMANHMPAPPVSELAKVERELVIKVDALMKLCPGKHNMAALPTTMLTQETLAWASKNKLAIPPAPVPVKPPPPSVAEIADYMKKSDTGYEGQKHVVNPSKVNTPAHANPNIVLKTQPIPKAILAGSLGTPVGVSMNMSTGQVDPITGKAAPKGLLAGGALPYGLEFKINVVDGPGVPKLGDVIVNEQGHALGRVAHIIRSNTSDGCIMCHIQVMPMSQQVTGPKPGPAGELAAQPIPKHPKDMTPAELVNKAKQIQQNILDHETKGTLLSPEAAQFLATYAAQYQGSLPVTGPAPASRMSGKVLTARQIARERFLRRSSRKERQKVSRVKKKNPGGSGAG